MGEAALQELVKFPDDWPETEYLSGAGYVGDWSGLLFKRKSALPSIISAGNNKDFQNQEMATNMPLSSWHS